MGLSDFFKRRKKSDVELPKDLLDAIPEDDAEVSASNLMPDSTAAEARPVKPALQQPFSGSTSTKSRSVVFLLCLFFGVLGLHRFYLGKTKSGILMLATLGGLAVWSLVDLVHILIGKFKDAEGASVLTWSQGSGKQGLVIRSDTVELLVMRGDTVVHALKAAYDPKKPEALSEAIEEVFVKSGTARNKIPVAIATRDVLFRYFLIPNIPRGEIAAAVKFEARKYIPFKPDDLVWDFYSVPSKQQGKLDVIYAAVPKTTLQDMLSAFKALKISPAFIEPGTMSLARLVTQVRDSQGRFVAAVQVQDSLVHIALVKDGIPYLARDVFIDIHGGAGADDEDDLPDKADVEAALKQRLISEIRVSTEFLIREYATASVQQVVLYGDEALIGGWPSAMAEELECPVRLGADSHSRAAESPWPLDYATPIGLLAKGTKGQIDLLTAQRKTSVEGKSSAAKTGKSITGFKFDASLGAIDAAELLKKINLPQLAIFCVLALGMMITSWVFFSQWEKRLHEEYARLAAARPEVEWGLTAMAESGLLEIQSQIQEQRTLIRRLNSSRHSLAKKLSSIAEFAPEGLWLEKIEYEVEYDVSTGLRPLFFLKGGSFLSDSTLELQSIQIFEQSIQADERFAAGFASVELGKIQSEVDATGNYEYQTFDLSAAPK